MHDSQHRVQRFAAVLVAFWLLAAGGPAVAQVGRDEPCRVVDGAAYLDGPQADPAKTSVVVFVHGVLSGPVGAWSSGKGTPWPCLLRGPTEPVFKTSNIYVYAYRTVALGPSPSIDQVAANLLVDLQNAKVLNHARITIVAHSMGGLVVSRMLLQMNADPAYRDKLGRIKLVEFYGTPATGSELADIASVLSGNVQFREMSTREDQGGLIDQWAAVDWPFKWHCLAEGDRVWSWGFIGRVVPPESATALCRGRPSTVEVLDGYNHISMVKPVSVHDEPHRTLARKFSSCVDVDRARTPASSVAGTPAGRLLLQMVAELRSSLTDDSTAGRLVMQPAVERALYQPEGWTGQYFMPKDVVRPVLTNAEFQREGRPAFANEFVRIFQPRADQLNPLWVTPLGTLGSNVPDGLLLELRDRWLAGGLLQDDDYVIGVDAPMVRGLVLLVAGIQKDAVTGEPRGRLRGFVVVPPEPQTCT